MASVLPGFSTSSSPLHTITGSMTTFLVPEFAIAFPAIRIISSVESIPVLMASIPVESAVSICFCSKSVGKGVTLCVQPLGSIVTTTVNATIPYVPCSWNVLRSACIPAPPDVSEPAIVNVFFRVM
ncbi:hypothetical protein D9M71_509820 [compost metagenome]